MATETSRPYREKALITLTSLTSGCFYVNECYLDKRSDVQLHKARNVNATLGRFWPHDLDIRMTIKRRTIIGAAASLGGAVILSPVMVIASIMADRRRWNRLQEPSDEIDLRRTVLRL